MANRISRTSRRSFSSTTSSTRTRERATCAVSPPGSGLLKAIENLPGAELKQSRQRQVRFAYAERNFKARYSHTAGARGGIEIVEVLPGRGC